jgi:tRNA uridine 5-carboxymethylaminomethyl modification enzyme
MTAPAGKDRCYDVIVVGAGVAGSEAAYHAAGAGLDTLLVTTSLDTVYNLAGPGAELRPPAGTLMAELQQRTAPAGAFVPSWDLHRAAKRRLEQVPELHLLQSNVDALAVHDGRLAGVLTWEGVPRLSPTVALCVGSFLHARLVLGRSLEVSGRLGEMAYDELYLDLLGRGFRFRDLDLATPADEGRPGYTVACKVFAPEEGGGGSRLGRVPGLYAAGLCLAGDRSYETTARQGRDLGALLVQMAR